MQFIFGPLLVLLGIMMMKYTVQITNYTGKFDWAERIFQTGTYGWWRIVGLVICILGAFWFFGLLSLVGDLLGSILPKPQY